MVALRGLAGIDVARAGDRVRRAVRLRDLRVSTLTLHRYREALQSFLFYCMLMFGGLAPDLDTLDSHAVDYVESLWEEFESKGSASTALAAIQHYLGRRRCLPRAWHLLSTWNLYDLPGRAPPLPADLLYALVGKALLENKPGLAAGLALGFAAFLRTGELLQVQYRHIRLSNIGGILALPLTKTGRRQGHQEMVPLEDAISLQLLWRCAAASLPMDTVMPTNAVFRKWWAEAMHEFGLDPELWRPYSIRRGGASHHFRRGGDLAATLFRGRWSSVSTARGYLVEGLALLAQLTVNVRTVPRGVLYIETLRSALN